MNDTMSRPTLCTALSVLLNHPVLKISNLDSALHEDWSGFFTLENTRLFLRSIFGTRVSNQCFPMIDATSNCHYSMSIICTIVIVLGKPAVLECFFTSKFPTWSRVGGSVVVQQPGG